MRDTFTWEVVMKAIARVSIAVPDEFLESLSQADLKELILNRSRLNVGQQNRLWTAIGPCDVRINDEVELLVDVNQLVAANRGAALPAKETLIERLKRYLVEAWRHVWN